MGREPILEHGRVLLARVKAGRPEQSMLLSGLRGVGKTVLLLELRSVAEGLDFRTIMIEARDDSSLAALLARPLTKSLNEINRTAGARQHLLNAMAVVRAFVGRMSVEVGDVKFGLDVEPKIGTADSGDIQQDLPDLLQVVGLAARERGIGLALLIDEVQYLSREELAAVIMSMHRMAQERLPVVLLGAGLPTLPALAGQARSYAERLFLFPEVGRLSPEDAARALRDPVQHERVAIDDDVIAAVVDATQGYPYFLQEWGYQLWKAAKSPRIAMSEFRTSGEEVERRLDQNFFRVRFDRLTGGERAFLRGMAELGTGPYRIAELAELLGVRLNSLSPRRAKLIEKGMIYSPEHGRIAFTVPLFERFMRRAMPEWPSPGA